MRMRDDLVTVASSVHPLDNYGFLKNTFFTPGGLETSHRVEAFTWEPRIGASVNSQPRFS